MKICLYCALFIFLLNGCGTAPKPDIQIASTIEVIEKPEIKIAYPRPSPLSLKPVKWHTLSVNDQGRYVEIIRRTNALVCLSPGGYEVLATNMSNILRYLRQSKILFEQYENERTP